MIKKVECDLSGLDKLPELVQATGIKPDVFYHFGWDGTFGDCRNDMYIQNMNVIKSFLVHGMSGMRLVNREQYMIIIISH